MIKNLLIIEIYSDVRCCLLFLCPLPMWKLLIFVPEPFYLPVALFVADG